MVNHVTLLNGTGEQPGQGSRAAQKEPQQEVGDACAAQPGHLAPELKEEGQHSQLQAQVSALC